MFKNIGELANLLSIIIGATSDLTKAGRCQTKIILETSEFDVQKKRAELTHDLALFMVEQEAKTPAIPEFKVA
jgi:hypothetical protein